MKKYVLLSLFLITISLLSFGQSQRLVLLEHFTQASCGPCATYNPQIDDLLNSNPDKITGIMYHTSWPGYDPMYNHNPSESGGRTSYYSVTSVPNSVVDGNAYNGHPNGWGMSLVNERYDIPSPFEISIYQELSEDESMINVAMLIKATEDVPAGMKAQIAVIEKYINFTNPPGNNTETEFNNVMKKMLPSHSGTGLPAFTDGDYRILQYSWELANVYDIDELAVVGFVQNNTSKEILQAANSTDELFDPLFATDAEIQGITNISQNYCVGNMQPHITIRNNGADNLTAAEINYTVNNGSPVTYQWTGDLAFLETTTIVLPESDFGVIETNTLVVTIENPNGEADEFPLNNARTKEIPKAVEADPTIIVILKLDDNPEETTWEFTNAQGEIIYEGGPYTTPGQQPLEFYDFESTNCYTFTIYDAGGDGLTGAGSFAVGFGSTIVVQGSSFGSKAEGQFNVSFTGVSDQVSNQNVLVYPNPVTDNLTLEINTDKTAAVKYSVFDPLGRELYKFDQAIVPAGQKNYNINLEELNSGIYYISVEIGSDHIIEKIILTK